MTTRDTPETQYSILTWDTNLEKYTPQDGVPELVTGFRGLIAAIRLLREAGYSADRNHCSSDPAVLIEKVSSPEL